MELIFVFFQNRLRTPVVTIDDFSDFSIDRMHGHIGNLLVLSYRTAEEHFAVIFTIGQRTQLLGKSPFCDHIAGNIRGTFDVVRGTRRNVIGTQRHLFCDTSAE